QQFLGPAVTKLAGTTFKLELNDKMEVTRFDGAEGGMAARNLFGGAGAQLASLLDRDGWKEMAQVSFFQPDRKLDANARWTKSMTHQWGALGRWTGQTLYAWNAKKDSLHQIAYIHNLAHEPSKGAAAGILPFQITGAAFQAVYAGGNIYFDAVQDKVVLAEERF